MRFPWIFISLLIPFCALSTQSTDALVEPFMVLDEQPLPTLNETPHPAPAPVLSSTADSDFYTYEQTLADFRGLAVTAQAGYRLPKQSGLEAGFELTLTFSSPTESSELEALANQALIQVYSPRNGLLRYRAVLVKDTAENPVSTTHTVVYQITERSAPFFPRFLNELEGGRTAVLIVRKTGLPDPIRLNLDLNLKPLQDLWHFTQQLPKGARDTSPSIPEERMISPLP